MPTGDKLDALRGPFSRGERNAWEEERQDILWIIYEDYKWAFCSLKLNVKLRAKNSLSGFASSSTDLLCLCSELLINILYEIYKGIIIYNTEASLMNGVFDKVLGRAKHCYQQSGQLQLFTRIAMQTSHSLLQPLLRGFILGTETGISLPFSVSLWGQHAVIFCGSESCLIWTLKGRNRGES